MKFWRWIIRHWLITVLAIAAYIGGYFYLRTGEFFIHRVSYAIGEKGHTYFHRVTLGDPGIGLTKGWAYLPICFLLDIVYTPMQLAETIWHMRQDKPVDFPIRDVR